MAIMQWRGKLLDFHCDSLPFTPGAKPSSHAFCLYVLMMQCMEICFTLCKQKFTLISLWPSDRPGKSPMHHKSKQRRQKAWDDGVVPSV